MANYTAFLLDKAQRFRTTSPILHILTAKNQGDLESVMRTGRQEGNSTKCSDGGNCKDASEGIGIRIQAGLGMSGGGGVTQSQNSADGTTIPEETYL